VNKFFDKILIAFKALRYLGITQVALNVLYRINLRTGIYRKVESGKWKSTFHFPTSFPAREQLLEALGDEGKIKLFNEADEIINGKFRMFGAEPVEIKLAVDHPLKHWTAYEKNHHLLDSLFTIHHSPFPDLKLLWEPARFGFAFTLGRAYRISGDDRFAKSFWQYFETFDRANPFGMGPHWMNGQEVALRMMAFVWAGSIFRASAESTPDRIAALTRSIAAHAERIPSTLIYARSQNNNHLLTEAAALYTASSALPDHPSANTWRKLGIKWIKGCFTHQIDSSGEYVQHSTNYQRLMLQTALWIRLLDPRSSLFTFHVKENLALATHWLYALLDPISGRVPNLGANDGALIFPLSSSEFADYRPIVQASARAFMKYTLPSGAWDEMALWFGLPRAKDHFETPRYIADHLYGENAWGMIRAVRYRSRPSHADQLHVDLWWRGLNIAQDAGTYLYNADPPWDNSLTSTLVHNTVSVNHQEQMTRVSRFLYLDWADAKIIQRGNDQITARTNAYRRFGVLHDRTLKVESGKWVVVDELSNSSGRKNVYRLHWLLPDWEMENGKWKVENGEWRMGLKIKSPHGWIAIDITVQPSELSTFNFQPATFQPSNLSTAVVSPTYSVKIPALSLAVEAESEQPITFITTFTLPQ
jgi:hypothetical protein